MKRKTAILYGESWLEDEYLDAEDRAFIEEALQALKQEPCDDMVSRGVFEQVMWERDVAISQLKKLGYELGQKVEPCEDEYIKVPKKALKYRTAGMVAYNAEWLKNHFDIERVAICGAQQPCEDTISRQAVLDALCDECELYKNGEQTCLTKCEEYHFLATLPSVKPQEPKTGHWIDEWLNEYKSCPIVICSNCSKGGFTAYKEFNYCPNCGCRMIEPQERSE